jgi:hypothetical protein
VAWTYQLFGFIDRALCAADGGFTLFAGQFFYLVELLVEVGLDQFEFRLIAVELLRALIGV